MIKAVITVWGNFTTSIETSSVLVQPCALETHWFRISLLDFRNASVRKASSWVSWVPGPVLEDVWRACCGFFFDIVLVGPISKCSARGCSCTHVCICGARLNDRTLGFWILLDFQGWTDGSANKEPGTSAALAALASLAFRSLWNESDLHFILYYSIRWEEQRLASAVSAVMQHRA